MERANGTRVPTPKNRRTKMVDETEVRRWIEEGRTYRWMRDQYLEKYNLQVSVSMFSEFRVARGLSRRIVRDVDLIPWAVREEHRYDYLLAQLRIEAKVRQGGLDQLGYNRRTNWEAFKRTLEEGNLVVMYDPDTEEGFFLVPREETDTDIVRQPAKRTGRGSRD